MAQGLGMHSILPQRDLIAGSIEAMANAHSLSLIHIYPLSNRKAEMESGSN